VAEYAFATDFYGFEQIARGHIAWPTRDREAEVIRGLEVGDLVVPKFAASPTTGLTPQARRQREIGQRSYCEAVGVDFDDLKQRYEETVKGGEAGVPFVLRVLGQLPSEYANDNEWARAGIEAEELAFPFSTQEFLRLRVVPPEISRQFKGMVGRGRHLQPIPPGTIDEIRAAGSTADRDEKLRRYSLVYAADLEAAHEVLVNAGRSPIGGDRAFLVGESGMLGDHVTDQAGILRPENSELNFSTNRIREVLSSAKALGASVGPRLGLAAADAIDVVRLASPQPLFEIDNFQQYYDQFQLLESRITDAQTVVQRGAVARAGILNETDVDKEEDEEPETLVEEDELVTLEGLTIHAVRQQLPKQVELPNSVLAEAVTALRSGKHLLLSGPPGTGKSTLAVALARAVVGAQYDTATATADWTTFDTIGGYMPTDQGLQFEPGVVLRCLQDGRWLIVDEVNRADIDKAFGPLFTLLAGTSDQESDNPDVILPYRDEKGQPISILWARSWTTTEARFAVTPLWRLIGTLNVSDKASLFQLSFAFLRRFAVVDVPIPSRETYSAWFERQCVDLPETVATDQRSEIVRAAINLATTSKRELGPAILQDIVNFMITALTPTASGESNYADAIDAFLTAVRLYAVPQYEGATGEETKAAISAITSVWPSESLPIDAWTSFRQALQLVAMA
jgi:MoxR-like ATPase